MKLCPLLLKVLITICGVITKRGFNSWGQGQENMKAWTITVHDDIIKWRSTSDLFPVWLLWVYSVVTFLHGVSLEAGEKGPPPPFPPQSATVRRVQQRAAERGGWRAACCAELVGNTTTQQSAPLRRRVSRCVCVCVCDFLSIEFHWVYIRVFSLGNGSRSTAVP